MPTYIFIPTIPPLLLSHLNSAISSPLQLFICIPYSQIMDLGMRGSFLLCGLRDNIWTLGVRINTSRIVFQDIRDTSLLLTLLFSHKAQQLPLILCFKVFIELRSCWLAASHVCLSLPTYLPPWSPPVSTSLEYMSALVPPLWGMAFTWVWPWHFNGTQQLAHVLALTSHHSSVSVSFSRKWGSHMYIPRPL